MSLEQSLVAELKREVVHLRAEQASVHKKIRGIEVLLSAYSVETRARKARRRSARVRVKSSTGVKGGLRLRDQITFALRASPGSTARSVAEALKAKGVVLPGKTPFNERVSRELIRLVHSGKLRREGSGFALVTDGVAIVTRGESVSTSSEEA